MRMGGRQQRPASGVSFLGILVVLIIAGVIAFVVASYKRWEGQEPKFSLDRDFSSMTRTPSLTLAVEDADTGLKQVSIRLKTKDQEVVLADESFEGPGSLMVWKTGQEKSRSYNVGQLIADKYKIQEGPATLTISASTKVVRRSIVRIGLTAWRGSRIPDPASKSRGVIRK